MFAGWYVKSMFGFVRNWRIPAKGAVLFCAPISSERELLLHHILTAFSVVSGWDYGRVDGRVIAYCINLHLPNGIGLQTCTVLFGEVSVQVFSPFFKQVVCFFNC